MASAGPANGRLEGYAQSRDVRFAGDLNGDRRNDVVAIAKTVRRYERGDAHDRFDMTAYDGRSGRQLWQTRIGPPEVDCVYEGCEYLYRYGYAFPSASAGVEVVVFSVINDGPAVRFDQYDPTTWSRWGHIFAVDLTTLDHRGRRLWTRHVEGRLDVEGRVVTLTDVPIVQGIGRTESDRATDWVFTVSTGRLIDNGITRANLANTLSPTGLSPYVPNADVFSSRVITLDGRNGRLRDIGDPAFGPAAVRDLTAVGDLSGDGRDDLVETHPYSDDTVYTNRASGGNGVVAAIRSSDGSRLWQRLVTAGTPARVTAVGDLTGDGRGEIVVGLLPSSRDATPGAVALDGATGSVLWEKKADSALRVGHVGGTRRSTVALAEVDRGSDDAVHVRAHDAAGSELWAVSLKAPGAQETAPVGAALYEAGDLDGDGVTDLDVEAVTVTTVSSGDTTTTSYEPVGIGFVSGRTGRLLGRVTRERPLHGSLDGRGDDAVTTYANGVTVRSGTTAKPLWQVGFGRRIDWGTAETDGRHGRCGNLLAWAYVADGSPDGTDIVGMFDRSGRLLWTRTFGKAVAAHPRTVVKTYRC